MASFRRGPAKIHASMAWVKGEAWGGRGRSTRGSERGVPGADAAVQASGVTELCYGEDLGRDLRFCPLFLASQKQGACTQLPAEGAVFPWWLGVTPVFIRTRSQTARLEAPL